MYFIHPLGIVKYRDSIFLCLLCFYQPRKLSFGNFGSLRKKKQDECEEYVCPMDVEMPKGRSFQKGFELQIYEDDLDRLEQVSVFCWVKGFRHRLLGLIRLWSISCYLSSFQLLLVSQMDDSEGTVRQIGAFSEGIQNLTVSIQSNPSRQHVTLYTLLMMLFLKLLISLTKKNNLHQSFF